MLLHRRVQCGSSRVVDEGPVGPSTTQATDDGVVRWEVPSEHFRLQGLGFDALLRTTTGKGEKINFSTTQRTHTQSEEIEKHKIQCAGSCEINERHQRKKG
jgi:hypothetical protein